MNNKLDHLHLAWALVIPVCAQCWCAILDRNGVLRGEADVFGAQTWFALGSVLLGIVVAVICEIVYRRSNICSVFRSPLPHGLAMIAVTAVSFLAVFLYAGTL